MQGQNQFYYIVEINTCTMKFKNNFDYNAIGNTKYLGLNLRKDIYDL